MVRPGLFGKLPAAGDFVSRGFSATLCDKLDGVIQVALVAAAGESGDTRQVLGNAPPLMIGIRAGALCETGFLGLWLPSCDRVGRAFPLCVGYELPAATAGTLPWPSHGLAMETLRTSADAIRGEIGPDELVARLATGDELEAARLREMPFANTGDDTVPNLYDSSSLFALQGPEQRMSIGVRALAGRLPWIVQALGSIVRGDGQLDWFFGIRNFPAGNAVAALFDLKWEHWCWSVTRCDESVDDDATIPPSVVGTADASHGNEPILPETDRNSP